MLETINLTNHFLIAMPNLADPNFYQTVTYICNHTADGAMGIIINRPILDVDLGDVLRHMTITVTDHSSVFLPVFEGGPVQRERGFVLHSPVGSWDSMLTVGELGITTSRDILTAIAKGDGPKQVLIALGYAGWAAGQLEKELLSNAWLIIPADNNIIFNTPPEKRWKAAASKLGIDLNLLSSEAGHG
ncbi:putative transcriptional regulator [Beggiatoa alba B18LD]|uniref:UPF0301 protein BegalDRAFT_3359 n=1 Tax=Beggiatoa alba B18LD TaxID=395493 RepID=I3CKN4_9GAMM|nr:YqgE/AlgH family protein [Beggiatoa alba]EIJ44177.1 putative transcriptional regulator [Beggiatoa alba B18LD]